MHFLFLKSHYIKKNLPNFPFSPLWYKWYMVCWSIQIFTSLSYFLGLPVNIFRWMFYINVNVNQRFAYSLLTNCLPFSVIHTSTSFVDSFWHHSGSYLEFARYKYDSQKNDSQNSNKETIVISSYLARKISISKMKYALLILFGSFQLIFSRW